MIITIKNPKFSKKSPNPSAGSIKKALVSSGCQVQYTFPNSGAFKHTEISFAIKSQPYYIEILDSHEIMSQFGYNYNLKTTMWHMTSRHSAQGIEIPKGVVLDSYYKKAKHTHAEVLPSYLSYCKSFALMLMWRN